MEFARVIPGYDHLWVAIDQFKSNGVFDQDSFISLIEEDYEK